MVTQSIDNRALSWQNGHLLSQPLVLAQVGVYAMYPQNLVQIPPAVSKLQCSEESPNEGAVWELMSVHLRLGSCRVLVVRKLGHWKSSRSGDWTVRWNVKLIFPENRSQPARSEGGGNKFCGDLNAPEHTEERRRRRVLSVETSTPSRAQRNGVVGEFGKFWSVETSKPPSTQVISTSTVL